MYFNFFLVCLTVIKTLKNIMEHWFFYHAFSNRIRFLWKIRASITQYNEPARDRFFFLILMFII